MQSTLTVRREEVLNGVTTWLPDPTYVDRENDVMMGMVLFGHQNRHFRTVTSSSPLKGVELGEMTTTSDHSHSATIKLSLGDMPMIVQTIIVCGLKAPRPPHPNVKELRLTLLGISEYAFADSDDHAVVFVRIERIKNGWEIVPIKQGLAIGIHSGWPSVRDAVKGLSR